MTRKLLVTASLVVALAASCTPTSATATPAASVAPTVPVHATPLPTTTVRHTPRVGGCTSPRYASRELLDRYFSLTTSGDVGAVIDCFAKVYRDKGDIDFSATRWASAGPLSSLSIQFVDTVKGCDRYAAEFQFVTPDPLFPNGFSIFYSVGPESGVMRIFDGGTGLVRPEFTLTACG